MPTLIVALAALLAVTVVRHPSAALIAAYARLRGKENTDDTTDDVGSRGKLAKALVAGVVISVGMSCMLGLMVWLMDAKWLKQLMEWFTSLGSTLPLILTLVIWMIILPTVRLVDSFTWLTKRRLVLVIAVQLAVIALWAKFDWWVLQNLLVAMAAVVMIVALQFRASFLRLSLVLLVAAFLYDAWQVYGTGNMTAYAEATMPIQETAHQARGYGIPALLVIPESFSLRAEWSGMLGLGDVFVGGVMAVTALRVGRKVGTLAPFYVIIVAYAVSLLCADIVIRQFRVAQPATIYIVPLCMGAVMLWAWLTGRWSELKKPAFGRELYAPDEQEANTNK